MIKDFYIKNMVCDRCIKVLKTEIEAQDIELIAIKLGRVQLEISEDEDIEKLKSIIKDNGFELIDSVENKMTEEVKILLLKLLEKLPVDLQMTLSSHLAKEMHHEYSKISKVFSITEGVTIEKYYIKLKIEKVKELIQNQEYNFTEMAQLLNYSNINHLSSQFKSETGMSLSNYKSQQENLRNPLDRII